MQYIPIDQWVQEKKLSESISPRSAESKTTIDMFRFVGQGVIKEQVVRRLSDLFPFASPEEMTRINSQITCHENLKEVAISIGLDKKMKVKKTSSSKVLGHAIESMVGELEQKRKHKDKESLIQYIIYIGMGL